jgi:serine/threonine-protein kinase
MGTTVVGRYVVLGPIGVGGIAIVYRAIDMHKPRRVAIKLLSPLFAGDPRARAKVHLEALITDRLRHPGVPEVFGFGDAELPDGVLLPYLAMELFTGPMLADRLAGGALPWQEAVTVAATVADVLTMAHRHGVVHRDLTPTNIMLTGSGAKIIDFGEASTVAPLVSGESPLPVREVSIAALPSDDVYALGMLLFQMLTGRSPYPWGGAVGSAGEPSAGRPRGMAPTPVLLVPGLPRPVAEICRGAMAKRAADRPDSADLSLALWHLLAPAGLTRWPWPAAQPPGPPAPWRTTRPQPGPPAPWRTTRPQAAALAGTNDRPDFECSRI